MNDVTRTSKERIPQLTAEQEARALEIQEDCRQMPRWASRTIVRYEDRSAELWNAFKNFHRLLCERFGYAHDEKDWDRDQLSLIEHIVQRASNEPRAPRSDDHLHLDEESGAVSVDHAAIVAAIRRERTEKADATPYMLNGTRFKLAFNNRGETSSFAGYHPQLHGRWVALVDATDDRHMRATQPPAPEHARPLSEWSEAQGPVVWWAPPVREPSYIGQPGDSDWPGYHTHWTPHPKVPANIKEPAYSATTKEVR